jgi:hypothetical protein
MDLLFVLFWMTLVTLFIYFIRTEERDFVKKIHQLILTHPDEWKIDGYRLERERIGLWIANGFFFLHVAVDGRGEFKLTPLEKIKLWGDIRALKKRRIQATLDAALKD